MAKKRVLMLGPGEPNIMNSGLGKAANNIANSISRRVTLTTIDPESLDVFNQSIQKDDKKNRLSREDFSDYKVLTDIAKSDLSDSIAPYWYTGGTFEITNEKKESEIRGKVDTYSEEVVGYADKADFDIIYAHDWLTFQAALEIKEKTNCCLILHVHSLDYDRNPQQKHSWVFDLEQGAFLKCDKILCVSNYSKKIIQEVYGIDECKIKVVYNGYTTRSAVSYKNPFKEKIVLFVGRLTNQKGPTQFLSIAEHIHSQFPNSRFIMAGDGELYQSLIETGAHSSIANKFHMTGYLEEDELDKLYAIADVYCMPSISEPFGLTAIEAAGAGVPLVITKNSGVSEVLEGAIKVDFHDTLGFANEVVKLLKNEKMKQYYMTKNRKAVDALTWQKTADQIVNLFDKL